MKGSLVVLIAAALVANALILIDQEGALLVEGFDSPWRDPGGWGMDMNLSNSDASFIGGELTVRQGWSISIAGDVNGDGIDDILIGVPMDDRTWPSAGQTFLFFGRASGWKLDTDLSSADASFLGEKQGDFSGISVSAGGDVNGDGFDDILIGASNNGEGGVRSGQTYLIFGKASGWKMDTYISSANASFIGENAEDEAGWRISIPGDVNNDGYDDIAIGAHYNGEGANRAGQTYLIFGKETGWTMDVNLSLSDASFIGEDEWFLSGSSVSGAGDVNNDGYDDLLIGSINNDEGGPAAGQTYLVLGKETGWTMDTDLSLSDASFIGEMPEDSSGTVSTGAGDVNGDGFDDILIGVGSNDEGGDKAGQTYVIFGKASGWTMDVNLSLSDASFIGEFSGDYAGLGLVTGVGDVNGDGFDDILIGAPFNDEGDVDAGQTYLVLGKASGWAMDTNISLSNMSFLGERSNVNTGYMLTGGGDVNGDGYDDIIIGSQGSGGWGEAYLLLGSCGFSPEIEVNDTIISSQIVEGVLDGEVEIKWDASDVEDDQDLLIDIFYQKDEKPPIPIVEDIGNSGSFVWNTTSPRVPDGTGYSIWISATDSDGNTRSNRTKFLYEIDNNDPPSIELNSPTDGMTIMDLFDIEWNADDGEDEASELSIDIWISNDGGVSFDPIIEQTNNTGMFNFQSREYPDGEAYRIKVTATDSEGLMSEDISGNFTIQNYPVFEFLTPTAGENITGDFFIFWSAEDPYYNPNLLMIDIWIMEPDGSNLTLLAENVSNDGFFKFNSTKFLDWNSYVFMVNVTNPYGMATTAFSEIFTIFNNDAPVVNFITPEEGDILTGTVEITWDSRDDLDDPQDLVFALYYQFQGTDLWNEIALDHQNNGSYLWNSLEALNGDGDYNLRVVLKDSFDAVSAPSTVNVSIYNPDAPEIKYPMGPDEAVRDGNADFEWIAEDPDPGENEDLKVWIYYSQDGAIWTAVEEGIPNKNGYSLNVSSLSDGTYSVKLVVSDCQPGDSNRSSEHIFEDVVVNNIDDAPVIEFLSEGFGSEIIEYEVLLMWKGEDADGDGITYSLFYQMEGTEEWIPIEGAQMIENTSFLWNISYMEEGEYKVKIVAKEDYSLGLEDEYITETFILQPALTLGGDDDGDRSITINYGLLAGIGAGLIILVLVVIYIMFLSARKKSEEEEKDEMDVGLGEEEIPGALEEEELSDEPKMIAEDEA